MTCGNPTVSTWILLKASLNPVHNGKISITILLRVSKYEPALVFGPKKTFQLLDFISQSPPAVSDFLVTHHSTGGFVGEKNWINCHCATCFIFPLLGEMNHNEFPFEMVQVFWGLGFFHLWRNSSDSSLGPPQMPSENCQTKHWTRTRT